MTLKVRDKVLMQEMKKKGKGESLLCSLELGPYTVTAKDGSASRTRVHGAALKKSVNCHRLKLWLKPDGGRLQAHGKRKSPIKVVNQSKKKKKK